MMKRMRYGALAGALGALFVSVTSLSTGTGCASCDAEKRCLQKEGLLVEGEIYPIYEVDPTHDGDRYTWATDMGDCACTLELNDVGQHHWRDCQFQ